jgi:hypothetical protein
MIANPAMPRRIANPMLSDTWLRVTAIPVSAANLGESVAIVGSPNQLHANAIGWAMEQGWRGIVHAITID